MKRLVIALALLFARPTYAKKPKSVNIKCMMYVKMWKPVILNMFADAGPTDVYLRENTLIISNAHCNDANVRAELNETFRPVADELYAIGMRVECKGG